MSNYRITFSKPLSEDKCELHEKYSYKKYSYTRAEIRIDGIYEHEYTVDANNTISFTDKKKEANGYSYNVEYVHNGGGSLIKNDDEYSSRYYGIIYTLINNGIDFRDILDSIIISNIRITNTAKHQLHIECEIKPLLDDKNCSTTIAEIKELVNDKDKQIERALSISNFHIIDSAKGHFSDFGEASIGSNKIWATIDYNN